MIGPWIILLENGKQNFRNVFQQHHSIGWKATVICIKYISCNMAIPSCIICDLRERKFVLIKVFDCTENYTSSTFSPSVLFPCIVGCEVEMGWEAKTRNSLCSVGILEV